MGSWELFAWAVLEMPFLLIFLSQVVGITGVTHCAQLLCLNKEKIPVGDGDPRL
jgi:hypothetical protein